MTQFSPHFSKISVTFLRFYQIFPIHFEAIPSICSFCNSPQQNPIRKSNKLSFENNKISFSSVSPNQHFNYLLHLQKKMTISNLNKRKFLYFQCSIESLEPNVFENYFKVFLSFSFIPFCSKGFYFPLHDMQEFLGCF